MPNPQPIPWSLKLRRPLTSQNLLLASALAGALLLVGLLSPHDGAADGALAHLTALQRVAPGELHEYPDIATDSHGTAFLTWVGIKDGHEHIFLKTYRGTDGLPAQDVGLDRGIQAFPRVLACGERVYVAWSAQADRVGNAPAPWLVYIRELSRGTLGELWQASSPDEDAVRPTLGVDATGHPWVAWESRLGKRFRIMLRPIDAASRNIPAKEVSEGGELNLRPVISPAGGSGLQLFWDRYEGSEYQIVSRYVHDTMGPMLRISDEPAVNLAPSVAVDKKGRHFIAWQTNADGRGGQRVGRTLRVRVLDGDTLKALAGGDPPPLYTSPTRLDAVEFPTLSFDGDGRLWLFARRGQGWVVWQYDDDVWKPPLDLSEKGWGGRGRELRAAWSKDGFHLAARRLHMISHQLLTPPVRPASPISLQELGPVPMFVPGASQGAMRNAPGAPNLSSTLPGMGGLWSRAIAPLLKDKPSTGAGSTTGSGANSLASNNPASNNPASSSPVSNNPASSSPMSNTGGPGSGGTSSGAAGSGGSSSATASPSASPSSGSNPAPASVSSAAGSELAPNVANIPPVAEWNGTPMRNPISGDNGYVLADGAAAPQKSVASASYPGQGAGEGPAFPAELPRGLYFGDLHTHTWMSDGAGDPDEVYTRSRDRYHYHFVALTDHDLENGNRILPGEWAYLKFLADFFNEPGKFVTFQAYEWTAQSYPRGAGHKNVYFPGDNSPLYNVASEAPDSKTLFELLQAAGALAAPHHIGWTGTDWENHDPAVQRAIEIVSVHGSFEKPGARPIQPRAEQVGMFARDGLLRGLKFGFLGGSDGHGFPWHYGVSRREDVWRTGLTGILATELSRTSLHAALMNRLTVATSGPPIGVWLYLNGAPMGTELTADRAPRIEVRVEGTAPLQEVALVRDGEDIQRLTPNANRIETTLFDEPSPGEHFYFLRVIQSNGEMAWSSPVWLEQKGQNLQGPPDP